MPYIYVEDDMFDAETMTAADVVTREDYNSLETSVDELRIERDEAVSTVETLTTELRNANDRYAKHVISAAQMHDRAKKDVMDNSTAQSFAELFSSRTEG